MLSMSNSLRWGLLGTALLALDAAAQTPIDFNVGNKPGDPLQALPVNVRSITTFGERAAFSPDGKKIAFIGAMYGDAFEYDIATHTVRNLTHHNPHSGLVRVHYLPDGNYLLQGPRGMGKTREDTRENRVELWYLDKAPGSVLVPLHATPYEGIAVSRIANRIAWSAKHGDLRAQTPSGYSALMTAEVGVDNGTPRLTNVREILRKPFQECVLEPQDFRNQDREVTASCYGGELRPDGTYKVVSGVWGVQLADGKMTRYYLDSAYNEPEGIAPDGSWTTVECGPAFGEGLDVCRLDLDKPGRALARMTRFLDYGRYRASNPVISPDGKQMAFQFGLADDEPGVGRGLLLMQLTRQ